MTLRQGIGRRLRSRVAGDVKEQGGGTHLEKGHRVSRSIFRGKHWVGSVLGNFIWMQILVPCMQISKSRASPFAGVKHKKSIQEANSQTQTNYKEKRKRNPLLSELNCWLQNKQLTGRSQTLHEGPRKKLLTFTNSQLVCVCVCVSLCPCFFFTLDFPYLKWVPLDCANTEHAGRFFTWHM